MLFKLEEFENTGFAILVWTENILKTELLKNNGITITM